MQGALGFNTTNNRQPVWCATMNCVCFAGRSTWAGEARARSYVHTYAHMPVSSAGLATASGCYWPVCCARAGAVTCQHGQVECAMNKMLSCAIAFNPVQVCQLRCCMAAECAGFDQCLENVAARGRTRTAHVRISPPVHLHHCSGRTPVWLMKPRDECVACAHDTVLI